MATLILEGMASLIMSLVLSAFSMILQAIVAGGRKPPTLDLTRAGQLVNTCDNKVPLPIVYGETRLGINRVYAGLSGTDNKYLHIIGNICEGEIKGIKQIDEVDQIFLGDKLYTEYGDKFYYEFFNGAADQEVCSTLHTAILEWNEPKKNVAYIYARFEYDPDVFQGLPDITLVIEGTKVWSPDTEEPEYTRNGALHARDFITRSSKRGGMGIAEARLKDDLVEDAAEYCVEKDWTCDICLRDEVSAVDLLDGILATFRGVLLYSDSIFQLKYKDLNYESAIMSITEDDIIEQGATTLRIEQPSIFSTPNAIRARFTNIDKEYTLDDYILADRAAAEADGDYREKAIDLVGVTSLANVQKLANYFLERERLNKQASLVMGTRGMALEPHDLIALTHSWPGWSEKLLRVGGVRVNPEGHVALMLQEEYASFYDDEYHIAPSMWYDTLLPQPGDTVFSVINVSHAEETYYYRGRTFTRWRVNFDRPAAEVYPFWNYADIYVKVGDGEWSFATKSSGDYLLDPVEEGTTYYVNIVSVSVFGTKQAFNDGYIVNKQIVGKDDLPSDLAWMTAVAHGDGVSIYAPTLDEPDIVGYEVRFGAAWEGGIIAGFNETPNFRFAGVKPGVITFWMKAKNNGGFYSENAVSSQVTVFYPPNYTEKNAWLWDYDEIGVHDNTECIISGTPSETIIDAMEYATDEAARAVWTVA